QARLGQLPEGIGNLRHAAASYERLASTASGVPEYKHGLRPYDWHNHGKNYLSLADALTLAGNAQEAQVAVDRSVRIHEKLVVDFPGMPAFWEALFWGYRDRGNLAWDAGQLQLAEQAYQRTLDVGEKLLDHNFDRFL